MRNILATVLVLGLSACSTSVTQQTEQAASSSSGSSATQQTEPACVYPANADTVSDAGVGCSPAPSKQICQVSNGATVLPDGGVSGGTESCKPFCAPSQYELTCKGPLYDGGDVMGSIPVPESSLGCSIIPIPTPSDLLLYCCPCAN